MSRLQIDDKEDIGPLRQWLECVQKAGNALLTTNYDMVLERGIRKLTKSLDSRPSKDRGLVDYGVEPELLFPGYRGVARNASPNSILLLKLHGSISWGYCKACKKAKLDPAYRGLAEDTLAGAARCLGPECSALLSPILVGPAKKRYDHPVIESIFTSAKEALERADEIVFAGFSLSSGDEKIGELLRKAHEIAHTTRVTIIDPKASELASRFEAIYGAGVEYTLENDWLEYLRGPSY